MRIASMECVRLSYRYRAEDAWQFAGGHFSGWSAAFIRLSTDDGVEGVGEIGDGLPAHEVVPAVAEKLKPLVIGQPLLHVRRVVDALFRSAPGWGRRGIAVGVIAGIESALFDALGKTLNVPVSALLGGAVRDRLPVYASGGMSSTPQGLQEELREYVAQGFRAVKMRIGHGLAQDVEMVTAAREVVGPEVALMLDAGQGYVRQPMDTIAAQRLARALEPLAPYWLEEPLHPEDIAGHQALRQATSIPIAGGENTKTLGEFIPILDHQALDILQPDAVFTGGMLEMLRIAQAAAMHGRPLAPHTWGAAPGLMANLHAIACIPNAIYAEHSQMLNPLRTELLLSPLQMDDGRLVLPEHPGLGVQLTDEILEAYPYDPQVGARLQVEQPTT